jgi:hypothetical protein
MDDDRLRTVIVGAVEEFASRGANVFLRSKAKVLKTERPGRGWQIGLSRRFARLKRMRLGRQIRTLPPAGLDSARPGCIMACRFRHGDAGGERPR